MLKGEHLVTFATELTERAYVSLQASMPATAPAAHPKEQSRQTGAVTGSFSLGY